MTHGGRSSAPPGPRGRGFTLMEILIAAVILGLGVLGLTALFAGAARQQQLSTQISNSVTVTQNGDALVSGFVGALDADDVSDPTDFDNYKQPGAELGPPCGGGDPLFFDRWYMAPAEMEYGQLSVNPNQDDDGLYFLIEETLPLTVYQRPSDFPETGDVIAVFDNVEMEWVANPSVNAHFVADADVPAGTLPPPYNETDGFTQLRHRRLWSRSVELQVRFRSFEHVNGVVPAGAEASSQTVAGYRWTPYRDAEIVHGGNTAEYVPPYQFWTNPEQYAVFYRNGQYTPSAPDYIVLEVENDLPLDDDFARVARFEFEPVRNASPTQASVLDEILVQRYDWRSDELVSVGDRIIEQDGELGPRPVSGYSVLFSRGALGLTRVAVFTYLIEAVERGGEFVPPETCSDIQSDQAVLRLAEVTLGYSEFREQFYARVNSKDLSWIVEPGSALLFAGEASNDPDDPRAADLAVTVVGQDLDPDGCGNCVDGFLNDAPRAGGRALLEDRSATITTEAWVVQELVESAADGSQWRLRPVEVRVFTVSDNQ